MNTDGKRSTPVITPDRWDKKGHWRNRIEENGKIEEG